LLTEGRIDEGASTLLENAYRERATMETAAVMLRD
jgi:hypothetical protein